MKSSILTNKPSNQDKIGTHMAPTKRYTEAQFTSVQFTPLNDWVAEGTWRTIQGKKTPNFLPVFSARGRHEQFRHGQGRPLFVVVQTASPLPAAMLPALQGWFWRGCRGVWHVRTMRVSVSWQLPEAVPWTQSFVLCSKEEMLGKFAKHLPVLKTLIFLRYIEGYLPKWSPFLLRMNYFPEVTLDIKKKALKRKKAA